MEGVSPTLQLLLMCKRYLSAQRSLRSAIISFVQEEHCLFARDVANWLVLLEQGRLDDFNSYGSIYRQQLLSILEKGLQGHSIYKLLEGLEEEVVERSLEEVEEFVSHLPFKMLIPLLLFQFPAFMLLILGPIIKSFLEV